MMKRTNTSTFNKKQPSHKINNNQSLKGIAAKRIQAPKTTKNTLFTD